MAKKTYPIGGRPKKSTVVKQVPRPSYFAGKPRPQVKLAPKQKAQPSKQLPVPKLGAITGGKPTVRPSTTFVPKLGAITGGKPTVPYSRPPLPPLVKPPPAPRTVNPGGGIKTGGQLLKSVGNYLTTTPTTSPTGVTRLATGRLSGNPTPGAPTDGGTALANAIQNYPQQVRDSAARGMLPDGTPLDPGGVPYGAPPGATSSNTPSLDDLFNQEVSSAYGGIDDAEKSAAAAMKSFNTAILDANLGGLLGSKTYASMISNILQDQSKQMTSYADQRAKLAASLPSEYNKLQSQLADQAAVNARLDFDYFKENASQQQWGAEFGLKQDQFGLDTAKYKTDTAQKNRAYGLDVAKLQSETALKQAGLGLSKQKLGLDVAKTRAGLQSKAQDRALKAAGLRLADQTRRDLTQATLGTRASIANQSAKTRVAIANQSAALKRAGLQQTAAYHRAQILDKVERNQISWAKLSQQQRKDAAKAYIDKNKLAQQWASIGIKKQSEQRKAAEDEIKLKTKKVSASTVKDWNETAALSARTAWQKGLSYQDVVRDLNRAEGIPLSIVQRALNAYYPRGKKGRPTLSFQERQAAAKKKKR